jgi:predicted GNAT family N-acyltransferase
MSEAARVLVDEMFDRSKHDGERFDCGSRVHNTFLRRYASRQNERGVSVVRVLIDRAQPSSVLGYYCLSPAIIARQDVGQLLRSDLSDPTVACFRMGKLATHLVVRGEGFGRYLLGLAVQRTLEAVKHVNAFALIVVAEDDNARRFFMHYGFNACTRSAGALFLPLRQLDPVIGSNS